MAAKPTRIKLKRSTTATVVPTTSNITNGEVALNIADRKLEEWFISDNYEERIASWDVEKLTSKLSFLHKTAIITALPVSIGKETLFHFKYVDLLQAPDIGMFLYLLENGSITIDHCISIKVGQSVAREQGPLFKIQSNAREDLYKSKKRYDLLSLDLNTIV